MKKYVISTILFWAIIYSSNAQNVIKVIDGFITIESKNYLGGKNDVVMIQRKVNDSIYNIAKVKLILFRDTKIGAKIIEEYDTFHIQIGDFVKGYHSDNYINDINENFMSDLLSQKETLNKLDISNGSEIRLRKKKENQYENIFMWYIGLDYGYAYRTAELSGSIPSDFKKYMNDLRSGSNLNVDIAYFFSKGYGIGLKYSSFHSSNQLNGVYVTNELTGELLAYGSMKDDIRTMLLGPGFYERLISANKKTCIVASVVLGYMGYKDDTGLIGNNAQITGKTIGLNVSFGAEYCFDPHWALGLSLSYTMGSLNKMEYNGYQINLEEPESLNFLSLDCGLRLLL